MRTIKFRGNRVDNGEWVYGDLHHGFITGIGYINGREIHPETLGQFTGLFDNSGKEIYEGDIVKCTDGADEINELNSDTGIGVIEWLDIWGFWNISNIENGLGDIKHNGYLEIIGNIHDNKELLNETK